MWTSSPSFRYLYLCIYVLMVLTLYMFLIIHIQLLHLQFVLNNMRSILLNNIQLNVRYSVHINKCAFSRYALYIPIF